MAGSGSVEDMIAYAKATTKTLPVAEVAETVEYESVLPVLVLFSSHPYRTYVFVHLIHYVSESVGHAQSQSPS